MCLDLHCNTATRSPAYMAQRGFAIVSAIFLLVVMASLGAFMVTFSTVQHTTSAQDLQGSRGYQAARAGIEWGLYQVLTPLAAPAATACTNTALGPFAGTLSGFTVNVNCTATPYTEAGTSGNIYQITSTATSGTTGSVFYIERQLQVTVGR